MEPDEAQATVQVQTPRRVYYADKKPLMLNWVAEGTDGELYLVPAEAGGWLRRATYEGPCEELVAVSPQKAHAITWYVYGDVGNVTIAHAEG